MEIIFTLRPRTFAKVNWNFNLFKSNENMLKNEIDCWMKTNWHLLTSMERMAIMKRKLRFSLVFLWFHELMEKFRFSCGFDFITVSISEREARENIHSNVSSTFENVMEKVYKENWKSSHHRFFQSFYQLSTDDDTAMLCNVVFHESKK